MTPDFSHPYNYSPQRYRLECQRLAALGLAEELHALAAAHGRGAEWNGKKPFVTEKKDVAA